MIKSESPAEFWENRPLPGGGRVHLLGLLRVTRRALLPLLRAVRVPLLRRADAVVAISAEIRAHFLALGVEATKVRSIPNAADLDRFRPVDDDAKQALRRKLSLPSDRLLLTYAGRLVVSKGVLRLVEVWEEVAHIHGDVHLVLVGSGTQWLDGCEPELKEFIRARKLEGRTSLPGHVDNVHEYLQASDLFVFPTDHEGFSLALVEALACGLPALATRVGAAPEVLDTPAMGVLIPPKDREALRRGLLDLLERRREWSAMGARARRRVAERYGFDAVIEQYLRLLRELRRA